MSKNVVLTDVNDNQVLPITVAGNVFYADQVTVEAILKRLLESMDTVRSRMDLFTTLGEGSTTGDAELVDLRVSINGTVYDSAGSAVRAQINTLLKRITELEVTVSELTRIIDNSGDVTEITSYAKLVGFAEREPIVSTVEEE